MSLWRRALVVLLTAALLLPAGCGKLELNQMALVMAVGLDKAKSGNVRVTAQIVRTQAARGNTQGSGGVSGEPVWIVSAEGKSIFEAIRNLGRFTSRRVFWAHNRVIVIGEDLAKDGIREVVDFFTRNHELRMNTWVVVTPGQASELVSTDTGAEPIPGDSIDRLFRFNRIVSEAPRTTIKEVGAAYLSRSSNPVIALVKKAKHEYDMKKPSPKPKEDQVELSGAAVFRNSKMLGTLSPGESRGLLWFIEKMESSVISLPCPGEDKHTVSLEMRGNRFKVTPSYDGEQVKFRVKLHVTMDLVELGCTAPDGTESAAKSLEKGAAAKYKGDLEGVLNKAIKVYKTDFLDLGKEFQNRYPGQWKTIRNRWQEVFAESEATVEVTAEITNPVLLILPTRPLGQQEGEND
ncbi:Ger(x)C family spore germination protein [Gorillibacterium sp. sgz5001074]|uniref:Ger(x)C family spore germination protein n=1 Tax=Gorillibacterium sp. sgz5001074 TaxID=3446695 RepID=UPI003F66F735